VTNENPTDEEVLNRNASEAVVGAFMDIREVSDVFVVGHAATMTQDGHPSPT
jgi:NADH dehydrogenase FAD-containing subunit